VLPAPPEREWLWTALETLIETRGPARFLTSPIVLPDDTHFPDRWSPDEHGVARVARRLLGYAGLDHLAVDVKVFTGETQVDTVGLDGRPAATFHDGAAAWFAGIRGNTCLFGIEAGKLDDSIGLVGALAHEVGHAFRHSYQLERADRDLEEKLTDVTTIYLGFGVLTTASASRFVTRHHDNLGSSYAHKQQGYLAAADMAFLLASQFHVRGYELATVKSFARHLPANQAATVRATLAAISREAIGSAMGFEPLPPPTPPPVFPARPLWRRLLGL
jgi:hypothetical protein